MDVQPVVAARVTADEALRERRVEVGRRRRDRVADRDRVGRRDAELHLADVRDHRVAGDDPFAVQLERGLERRRQAQRHLDDVAAVREREQPRRVAAVPRLVRAAKPAVDHDGHTGFSMRANTLRLWLIAVLAVAAVVSVVANKANSPWIGWISFALFLCAVVMYVHVAPHRPRRAPC